MSGLLGSAHVSGLLIGYAAGVLTTLGCHLYLTRDIRAVERWEVNHRRRP
jgi:hypothetical protein